MQQVEVSYEGGASCVPQARHAVEATLTTWGRDDVSWAAALLVSELAANVALHARTAFSVRLLALGDGAVRLEVADGSPRAPRQRRFGEQATTGRGLNLVEDLSRAWGVDRRADGKTVWAELPPGQPGLTADADPDADVDALLLAFPDLDDGAASGPQACAARAATAA